MERRLAARVGVLVEVVSALSLIAQKVVNLIREAITVSLLRERMILGREITLGM